VDLLAVWHQGALDLDVARELLEHDLGVRTCAVSVCCARPRKAGGRTHDDVRARLEDALAGELALYQMRSIASALSWIASELPVDTVPIAFCECGACQRSIAWIRSARERSLRGLSVESDGGGGKGVRTRDQLLILVNQVLVYGLHHELVHIGRHPCVDEASEV
jgi:hypothetical protein